MELKSSSSPPHSISTFDQTVDFNNHLFSSIVALYILIFLYFPTLFFNIVFSPVFVSTGVLLVFLLRLGASQETRKLFYSEETLQSNDSSDKTKPNQTYLLYTSEEVNMYADVMSTPKHTEPSNDENYTWDSCDFKFGNVENSFVEWNVKAPLEIIYEDDEEEEDDDRSKNNFKGIERYPSLSLYYPESDSDCSSDDDFAMDMNWEPTENASATFKWDEMGEELIEIALDGKKRASFFNDEEDSLIEIDISPGRNNEFAGLY